MFDLFLSLKKKKKKIFYLTWSLSSPRVALSPVSGSTADSISASAFLPLLPFLFFFSLSSPSAAAAAAPEEEEEEEEGEGEEELEEAAAFTALSIRPSILWRTRSLACRARPKAENLPRL